MREDEPGGTARGGDPRRRPGCDEEDRAVPVAEPERQAVQLTLAEDDVVGVLEDVHGRGGDGVQVQRPIAR